jgi:hypothetical protein
MSHITIAAFAQSSKVVSNYSNEKFGKNDRSVIMFGAWEARSLASLVTAAAASTMR